MSRVIKFRAWDVLAENMFGINDSPQEFWSKVHPASCDVYIMQFTGLHDKDGKEIYEGDVVKHTMPHQPYAKRVTILGLIEYVEVSCSFRTVSDYYGEEPIHEDIEIEVIGNIHENPELLEE